MVEHSIAQRAKAGLAAYAKPTDLDSIVDRLLAVAEPQTHGDEVDRAVNRRAQLTLALKIKGLIERDDADASKAA